MPPSPPPLCAGPSNTGGAQLPPSFDSSFDASFAPSAVRWTFKYRWCSAPAFLRFLLRCLLRPLRCALDLQIQVVLSSRLPPCRGLDPAAHVLDEQLGVVVPWEFVHLHDLVARHDLLGRIILVPIGDRAAIANLADGGWDMVVVTMGQRPTHELALGLLGTLWDLEQGRELE